MFSENISDAIEKLKLVGLSGAGQAKMASKLWAEASEEKKQECEQTCQEQLKKYREQKASIPQTQDSDTDASVDEAQTPLPKKPFCGAYGVFRARLRQEAPETLAGLNCSQQATKAKELWDAAPEQSRKECEQSFRKQLADYHAKCDEIAVPVQKRLNPDLRKVKRDAREKKAAASSRWRGSEHFRMP